MGVMLKDIIADLGPDCEGFTGDSAAIINRPASLSCAKAEDICFSARTTAEAVDLINASCAETILVPIDFDMNNVTRTVNIIRTLNPRLAFIRIAERHFAPAKRIGIHHTAFVDAEAEIAPDAFIGPNCYVGKSKIGPSTVLHGGIFVYDGVTVGRNVTIHAGAILGADGFGYERAEDGTMEKFPHFGGIVIEDDVEIGANTCVDRGTLDDTLIKRGAKIDNFVHIAHNTIIGQDAVVIAHAMIGGSTRINDRAWIAPSACLRDKIEIGEDAVIGLGSVVTKDVPAGTTVLGSPARPLAEYKKVLAATKRLLG